VRALINRSSPRYRGAAMGGGTGLAANCHIGGRIAGRQIAGSPRSGWAYGRFWYIRRRQQRARPSAHLRTRAHRSGIPARRPAEMGLIHEIAEAPRCRGNRRRAVRRPAPPDPERPQFRPSDARSCQRSGRRNWHGWSGKTAFAVPILAEGPFRAFPGEGPPKWAIRRENSDGCP